MRSTPIALAILKGMAGEKGVGGLEDEHLTNMHDRYLPFTLAKFVLGLFSLGNTQYSEHVAYINLDKYSSFCMLFIGYLTGCPTN